MPPRVRLPAVVQTLAALRWGDWFGALLMKRGPAIWRIKVVGVGEVVITWDPAIIKQVFGADTGIAQAGEINRRVIPILGEHSVMRLDGERHLRMRRMLLPHFHGEALKRYVHRFEQITAAEIQTWPRGEEFAIHPCMQRITLTAILQAMLGVREGPRLQQMLAVLPRVLDVNPIAVLIEGRFPRLAQGVVGRRLPWIRARAEAQALIREQIAEHRSDPEGRDDILASLLAADGEDRALSDEEIEDQLGTLLLAGHETTASALAFCFERLARHPNVAETLKEELARGDESYLEAVVNETLRVRPPVEVTWRQLAAPLRIDGYLLPAETVIVPGIRAVQNSEAFEDADQFRPERFIESKPAPYTLIPFGGGTRRCLGASFAVLEMKAVLRVVFRELELQPTSRKAERRDQLRRFTSVPAGGARVMVLPIARAARAAGLAEVTAIGSE